VDFIGVVFHPEENDYLLGVSWEGKAVLLKIN
jgi:hypothetical protein